jgi:type II secretory pathway component PulK
MVLVIVLVFALLLVSAITTFLRRATLDSFVVRNRDAAARAEALARGGVELGVALLLEDRLEEEAATEGGFRVESRFDPWARVADLDLDVGEGASLRLAIEDAGARLNLNALAVDAEASAAGGGAEDADLTAGDDPSRTQSFTEADAEAFLAAFLAKVIEEMPGRPEQKNYDVEELVLNLVDWVDADDVRRRGGLEDEWYQGRTPPYRAANQPLLSVDELRRVQGFDGKLVEALAPYVGVFPLAPKAGGEGEEAVATGLGVNPNTAPSWVLALLYHGDPAGGRELAKADEVAAIVKEREKHLLCERAGGDAPGAEDDGALTSEACVDLLEAADVDPSTIFPPPTWQSDFFTVAAEASVGEIRRRLEVVVDRSDPSEPRRLAWRMR